MVGPLIYDLAKLHVDELLAERATDRPATQVAAGHGSRLPKFDVRRLFTVPRPPMGSARAAA